MIENAQEFLKALRKDRELAGKYDEVLRRIGWSKDVPPDSGLVTKAANELGYDFTAAEMDKATAGLQELDPDELEGVAGGWCWGDYGCYTAYHHNGKDTACVYDYSCMGAYKGPNCSGVYHQGCPQDYDPD